MTRYPYWQATRSNEDFDRAQQLADKLTAKDRARGKYPRGYGYGVDQFNRAMKIVRAAQR